MKYFETIKCNDYEIFNLDYHEKRVAKTIAMNINLQEYIYAPSKELLRCKIIYDETGILSVDYFSYKKRKIKNLKIIKDNNIFYKTKALDRTFLDKLFLKKESCDEILIFKNDLLTDTSIANIAIFYENFWFTPRLPLLEGTTRARLLEEKMIFEKDITLEMLQKASKIALMNAMIDFDILEDYSLSL